MTISPRRPRRPIDSPARRELASKCGAAIDEETIDAAQLYQAVKAHLPGALPGTSTGRVKAFAKCTWDEIVDALNAYVATGCGLLDRAAALRRKRDEADAAAAEDEDEDEDAAAGTPAPARRTATAHELRAAMADQALARVVDALLRRRNGKPFDAAADATAWWTKALRKLPPYVLVRVGGRVDAQLERLYAGEAPVAFEAMFAAHLEAELPLHVDQALLLLANRLARKPTAPELEAALRKVHKRTESTPLAEDLQTVVRERYDARASPACEVAADRRARGAFEASERAQTVLLKRLRPDDSLFPAAPPGGRGSQFLSAQDRATLAAVEPLTRDNVALAFPHASTDDVTLLFDRERKRRGRIVAKLDPLTLAAVATAFPDLSPEEHGRLHDLDAARRRGVAARQAIIGEPDEAALPAALPGG